MVDDADESAVGKGASQWSVHWRGLLVAVAIVPVALIGWFALGDSDRTPTVASGAGDPTADAPPPATTVLPTTTTPDTTPVQVTAPLPATTIRPGRTVTISGEMKPCRFGANCLAASFVIEGFDPHPESYICIYPNSSTEIGFRDNDVIDACLSADEGDTITIEVAGVRSATISEQRLNPNG